MLFGTGLVFMREWDLSKLRQTLQDVCERTHGPDWGAVASRLARLLPWEFDYRYDEAVDQGEPFPRHRKP